MPTIKEAGAEFAIDTTGQALLDSLKYQPLVIKPNQHELEQLFDTDLVNEEDILKAAKKLQEMGAQNVLISLAANGAYLVTKDHIYYANAAQGITVNSVGAVDSMIAGFVGTNYETQDAVKALQVGAACGGATAFSEGIGVKSQIDTLLPQIKVQKIR